MLNRLAALATTTSTIDFNASPMEGKAYKSSLQTLFFSSGIRKTTAQEFLLMSCREIILGGGSEFC